MGGGGRLRCSLHDQIEYFFHFFQTEALRSSYSGVWLALLSSVWPPVLVWVKGKQVELSMLWKVSLCRGLTAYFLFWGIWGVLCVSMLPSPHPPLMFEYLLSWTFLLTQLYLPQGTFLSQPCLKKTLDKAEKNQLGLLSLQLFSPQTSSFHPLAGFVCMDVNMTTRVLTESFWRQPPPNGFPNQL